MSEWNGEKAEGFVGGETRHVERRRTAQQMQIARLQQHRIPFPYLDMIHQSWGEGNRHGFPQPCVRDSASNASS